MLAESELGGGRVRSRDGTGRDYLTVGTGPTVLCLHGALASGLDWLPVAWALRERYRFVLLDRRGHGGSDAGLDGHSLALEIEDLSATLDVSACRP